MREAVFIIIIAIIIYIGYIIKDELDKPKHKKPRLNLGLHIIDKELQQELLNIDNLIDNITSCIWLTVFKIASIGLISVLIYLFSIIFVYNNIDTELFGSIFALVLLVVIGYMFVMSTKDFFEELEIEQDKRSRLEYKRREIVNKRKI